MKPLVRLNCATVSKNQRTLLDNVSLTISPSQHTAILGPNGCGKSTLLKLITFQDHALWRNKTLRDETLRAVEVLGETMWDVFELRKRIGLISAELQFRFLHEAGGSHLNGLQTVLTGFFAGRDLYPHQTITPAMIAAAKESLARVHATSLADKPLEWLSTGEMRRVLIARALVTNPVALILDEPTVGLDAVAAAEFLTTVRNLASQRVTLILVTHHAEEIIPEIQQVALMNRGRIVNCGPPEAVLTSATISAAYESALCVTRHAGTWHIERA